MMAVQAREDAGTSRHYGFPLSERFYILQAEALTRWADQLASPAVTARDAAVFEVVDATDEDQYFTIGVFRSLKEAIEEIASFDSPESINPNGCYEEVIRIEVRERKIGWDDWPKPVHVATWVQHYDEAKDEYRWEPLPASPNGPRAEEERKP